jgi:ubiquinone/menaquinone biosynthesis C-methylase UbiE
MKVKAAETIRRSLRSHLSRRHMFDDATSVEAYWTRHTVNSTPFSSAEESADYLEWRFAQYPLFREFMDLWGEHQGETVLDYGCGPGDDVMGFALYSGAGTVVGADVSARALELASGRAALHGLGRSQVQFVKLSDARPGVPLGDGSIDYLHCAGVLQHTSDPETILHDLHRVLRPEAMGRAMVYNRNSVWFHLYTAYTKRIVEHQFGELSLEEAFARNTDGPEVPIARCYSDVEFVELCARAGFQAEYLGGYPAAFELEQLRLHRSAALEDRHLGEEQRSFLADLESDEHGYPIFRGKHAGIGGVYILKRA